MNLKQITSKNLIAIDCDFHSKKEVIEFLMDKLYADGKLTSKEEFFQAVMAREELS